MKIVSVISLSATLFLASEAIGAEPLVRQVEVSYADLDLASTEGVMRLERRVRTAVSKICVRPRQGVLATSAESICRRSAAAGARSQIDRAIAKATSAQKIIARAN